MLGFGLQLCIHPTLGKGIWLAIVHHFALVHYPQIHLPTIDKVSGRKPYHRNPDIGILVPLPMADWWGFLAQSAGSNHCWLAFAYPHWERLWLAIVHHFALGCYSLTHPPTHHRQSVWQGALPQEP